MAVALAVAAWILRQVSRCGAATAAVFFLALLAGLFSGVRDAKAVILYASGAIQRHRRRRRTRDDHTNEGWDYEEHGGSFLATPFDATHFIAAAPCGGSELDHRLSGQHLPGEPVVRADRPRQRPGSVDPAERHQRQPLSLLSPLYNASPTADGSLAGKTLTVIGRGTQARRPGYRRRRDGGMVLGGRRRSGKLGAKRRQWNDRVQLRFSQFPAILQL